MNSIKHYPSTYEKALAKRKEREEKAKVAKEEQRERLIQKVNSHYPKRDKVKIACALKDAKNKVLREKEGMDKFTAI